MQDRKRRDTSPTTPDTLDDNNTNYYYRAAKIDIIDCTKHNIFLFCDQNDPFVEYFDFPGFGMLARDDYINLLRKEYCTLFVYLYTGSISMLDLDYLMFIHTELRRPILIARTKIDSEIRNLLRQAEQDELLATLMARRKVNEERVLLRNVFGNEYQSQTIYMVSCLEQDMGKWEFEEVINKTYSKVSSEISKLLFPPLANAPIQFLCIVYFLLIKKKSLKL